MAKLTIDDIQLKGKNVFVRVDFNVPFDDNHEISDDLRIRAALPTIQKIISSGGRAILSSHLGRPKGERKEEFSLKPVSKHLSSLLNKQVLFVDDCIGEKIDRMKRDLKDGEVLLLENVRFHSGETENDDNFAKELARYCDVYINDAFGSAHRAHASTHGITKYFDQCVAGYLMRKELEFLGRALEDPEKPFVAILGGAKISGKIEVIKNLLGKTDALLVGGGMVFTFYKAQRMEIGKSILEEDRLQIAREILADAQESDTQFKLPLDVVVADKVEAGANTKTVPINEIPSDWQGVDIGGRTISEFNKILSDARTIVWNGPMGVFEIPDFARGTEAIARSLVELTSKGATTIVGGGDSAAAVKKFGFEGKLSHVSTGGGASLEFLEGKKLPGVEVLTDK
jgi:phosphoglycerate kinase